MAVYVGGLRCGDTSGFRSRYLVRFVTGAVPMADAVVVVIPRWDLVIREETLTGSCSRSQSWPAMTGFRLLLSCSIRTWRWFSF